MKHFEYRLATLLRLKEQQQRQAELKQQKARAEVEVARTEAASLQKRMAEAASAGASKPGQPAPPGKWIAHLMFVERIGQALTLADARLRQVEQVLRDADAARVKITTEVEALTFLKKQKLLEYRRGIARAEQAAMDDMELRRRRQAPAEGHAGSTFGKGVNRP